MIVKIFEETLGKIGAWANKPVSVTRVLIRCDLCLEKEWESSWYRCKSKDKHYCQSCKNILGITGTKNRHLSEETCKKMSDSKKGHKHSEETKKKIGEGNKGKVVPEESRKKVSEANKGKKRTEDVRKKMSERCKGEGNNSYGKRGLDSPCYGKHHSEEAKAKTSLALKGKYVGEKNWNYGKPLSKETKQKLSKSNIERILDGSVAKQYDFGKYFSTKMNKEMVYRSSYELAVLKYLDQASDVIRFFYENRETLVEYEFEGIIHRYLPDFLVEYAGGQRKIVEVKPKFATLQLKNAAKIAAAQVRFGDKYEVWTEDILQKRGIL